MADDERLDEELAKVKRVEASNVDVQLRRAEIAPTADQALWVVIRKATDAISYNHYESFIDVIMCPEGHGEGEQRLEEVGITRKSVRAMRARRSLPFPDVEAY